ncbi:MAG: hypothetical protein H0W83_13290, partial [Planctomycetes bacterium]|nr:hypothetical protein [Planctomycetota bacterium]
MDALPMFTWPVAALPDVLRAGRYPFDDRGFEVCYRSPTHALHVYEYHGAIRIGDRSFTLAPGDATISPVGIETRYDLPRRGHHWCVHFHPVEIRGASCRLPTKVALGSLRTRVVEAIQR